LNKWKESDQVIYNSIRVSVDGKYFECLTCTQAYGETCKVKI